MKRFFIMLFSAFLCIGITLQQANTAKAIIVYPPIEVTVSYDKTELIPGQPITTTFSITGGSGSYKSVNAYWFKGYKCLRCNILGGVKKGSWTYYPSIYDFVLYQDNYAYLIFEIKDTAGHVANIELDPIRVNGGHRPVKSVTLNYDYIDVSPDAPATLVPTITPSNATNLSVSWTSSIENIVSINNGTLTVLNPGVTVITCTAHNGYKDTCTVVAHCADHCILPSNLNVLKEDAFAGSAVKDIILPEGLTDIPKGAFRNCENLMLISLPSTIETIAADAFENCSGLIFIGPENDSIKSLLEGLGFTYHIRK